MPAPRKKTTISPAPAAKAGAAGKKPSRRRTKGAARANLLIVESPAKQRTISRFLKKGFVVASSYGHVRDLPEKKLGVDEKKDFEPTYTLLARTKKLLPELKKLAKNAEYVYLATDHDREGESIAWHLVEILGLEPSKIRRITFHEITPQAITAALESPRDVDLSLVHAQQARRVIDRLVGYKLSPLLWRKIRRGLSAGRVQSVAVRLLVERDKEIAAFETEPFWTLSATFLKPDHPPQFEARLSEWKGQKVELSRTYQLFAEEYRVKTSIFKAEGDVEAVRQALAGGVYKVTRVERKEVRRRPAPPFITSTLQQAGSQQLGFAAERTMRIAQSLYEGADIGADEPTGLITYMRTDSVNVADAARQEAAAFVKSSYGDAYVPDKPPVYTSKVKGAQEAHEAIRPTSVHRTPDSVRKFLTPEQAKLYTLIWKRFLASQMKEALFDTISADISSGDAVFRAAGRTLKFDGFLRVLKDKAEEDGAEEDNGKDNGGEEKRLPDLEEGDAVEIEKLSPDGRKTSPPPYYNEGSLIRALEKHGIGRPSTYAPTIKTIVDRGYVRRGTKDRRLTPAELGTLVVERLNKHFAEQMSLSYTAHVEEQLDQVAEGSDRWQDVVGNFYGPFAKALALAQDKMEDSRVEPKESDETCPVCGAKMLIRESRFGKYLSCGNFPRCRGKMQLDGEGKKIVPEATDETCDLCDKPMVIRTGRKGKFLACSGYPKCKNTYSLDAQGRKIEGSRPIITSRKCNKCGSAMWMRLGKRGHFLACSGFPKCRNLKPLSKVDAETLKAEADAAKGKAVPHPESSKEGTSPPGGDEPRTEPGGPRAAPDEKVRKGAGGAGEAGAGAAKGKVVPRRKSSKKGASPPGGDEPRGVGEAGADAAKGKAAAPADPVEKGASPEGGPAPAPPEEGMSPQGGGEAGEKKG
ncbi:MAG: type I DNA topoisomerase [Elusimicrobiota bacterium]